MSKNGAKRSVGSGSVAATRGGAGAAAVSAAGNGFPPAALLLALVHPVIHIARKTDVVDLASGKHRAECATVGNTAIATFRRRRDRAVFTPAIALSLSLYLSLSLSIVAPAPHGRLK